jgi:nucleoside-diphosphate-sugar epimerase
VIALVTGATGFVGRHLIATLPKHGYTVRALALPGEETGHWKQDGISVYPGDVCAPETLIEPMHGADIVFHLAAVHGLWRPKQEYYSVNLVGTENVCRCALKANVRRLMHVSSWVVYGMGIENEVHEDFPLRPVPDTYAVTKAHADMLVQRFILKEQLPATIVRPGTMFGPGDSVNFKRLADRVRARKAVIIGSGRNLLPFVYVSDVVNGMLLAAKEECAVGRCYNLSNDRLLTQQQLWTAIAKEIGAEPPFLHVPYSVLYALATMAELAVGSAIRGRQPLVTRLGVKLYGSENRHSIAKARAELKYQPRISIQEGVRHAAKWYLEQNNGSVAWSGSNNRTEMHA